MQILGRGQTSRAGDTGTLVTRPGLAWTLLGSFLHDTCGAGAGGRLGLTGDNPLSQVAGARAQAREHWDSGTQADISPIGAGMCPNAGSCIS